MSKKYLLFFVTALCFGTISAQGLFEGAVSETEATESESRLDLTGYARGSAYGGSDNYDYSNLFGEFVLQGRLSKGKTLLYADVRTREGLFFGERQTIVELKEAYAAYRSDVLSLFMGNQIVSWGRTDGFNPTDNINPNDFFFLTPDPDDQIMSNFMMRSQIRFAPNIELELLAIPVFLNSNYRYDLFDMGDGAFFSETALPEKTFKNSSFGARINFEFPAIGFSISYFDGYDPFYGFRVEDIQMMPDVRIDYIADFYKKNTIGADFELPVNNSIFRGEFAYNNTTNYKENMHIPNPDISYVLGFERSFFNIISIFQYIGKHTLDFQELSEPELENLLDPAAILQYSNDLIIFESELFNRKIFHQQEDFNHALLISLNRSFAYELIDANLTGYYNITSEEYLVRPEVSWKITDELTAKAGASLMYGKENSVFDRAGNILNGVFISLKASF